MRGLLRASGWREARFFFLAGILIWPPIEYSIYFASIFFITLIFERLRRFALGLFIFLCVFPAFFTQEVSLYLLLLVAGVLLIAPKNARPTPPLRLLLTAVYGLFGVYYSFVMEMNPAFILLKLIFFLLVWYHRTNAAVIGMDLIVNIVWSMPEDAGARNFLISGISVYLVALHPEDFYKLYGVVGKHFHLWVCKMGLRRFSVDEVYKRTTMTRVEIGDLKCVRREFAKESYYENEATAYRVFQGKHWLPEAIELGSRVLVIPSFDDTRLDLVGPQLSREQREEVARQAVWALFDMHFEGYAHRDFHCKNLYWYKNNLYVTDFEVMAVYPTGDRPAFPRSYDVSGHGLESPLFSGRMCYESPKPFSVETVLGIPLGGALIRLQKHLIEEYIRLLMVRYGEPSAGFVNFSLPNMRFPIQEPRRDFNKLLKRLGTNRETVEGKRILVDWETPLSVALHLFRSNPSFITVIERDKGLAHASRAICAYNGLNDIVVVEKLDETTDDFDVIFLRPTTLDELEKSLIKLATRLKGDLYLEINNSLMLNPESICVMLNSKGFRSARCIATDGSSWFTARIDRSELDLDFLWYLGEAAYARLKELISDRDPKQLVELGSGVSTIRLAKDFPQLPIVSFDDNRRYYKRVLSLCGRYLPAHHLLSLRHSPLRYRRIDYWFFLTYKDLSFDGPAPFVLIDGPSIHFSPRGREACLYLLYDRIPVGGVVVLDDFGRPCEKRIVRNWMRSYPGSFSLEEWSVGHGMAVLKKVAEVKRRPLPLKTLVENLTVDYKLLKGQFFTVVRYWRHLPRFLKEQFL